MPDLVCKIQSAKFSLPNLVCRQGLPHFGKPLASRSDLCQIIQAMFRRFCNGLLGGPVACTLFFDRCDAWRHALAWPRRVPCLPPLFEYAQECGIDRICNQRVHGSPVSLSFFLSLSLYFFFFFFFSFFFLSLCRARSADSSPVISGAFSVPLRSLRLRSHPQSAAARPCRFHRRSTAAVLEP